MTTAGNPDADRFHIPPMQQPLSEQLQNGRPVSPLMHPTSFLPSQPTVIATSVVDLAPLLRHFEAELSAARAAAADAKCEARGHRERVVEVEARLKAALEERDRAVHSMEQAQCDARDAQQMLMDERKRSIEKLRLARNETRRALRAAGKRRFEWSDSDRAKLVRGATVQIVDSGVCDDGIYTVHEFIPPGGLWVSGGDIGVALEDYADPATLVAPGGKP